MRCDPTILFCMVQSLASELEGLHMKDGADGKNF